MAAALGVLVSCGSVKSGEEVVAASRDSKVVVAYVTSWSEVMPDPQYMTHINYAFGHVNESFNGVKIDNEERLRQIVDLRKQKPELICPVIGRQHYMLRSRRLEQPWKNSKKHRISQKSIMISKNMKSWIFFHMTNTTEIWKNSTARISINNSYK